MEPGPTATYLDSYNPLYAKFTMKKSSFKSTQHFVYRQQFIKQEMHQTTFDTPRQPPKITLVSQAAGSEEGRGGGDIVRQHDG